MVMYLSQKLFLITVYYIDILHCQWVFPPDFTDLYGFQNTQQSQETHSNEEL